ncbi:hypothetical protein L1987_84979 [Smallanthus sonchifolius]|uniref:Uncharacterized protein n=1 Tax=Smallanthus sonchifolius TaxID=185202 RepID=A0ACB8XVN8_9ASTR|nr:hypothetical protein L1987_84979 [Smallanthus sonchifolius]
MTAAGTFFRFINSNSFGIVNGTVSDEYLKNLHHFQVRILGRKVPPASTCRLAHFNSPPISGLFQTQIQIQFLIHLHFIFTYLVNLNPHTSIHLGGSVFVQDFTICRLSYDLPMHLNLISA